MKKKISPLMIVHLALMAILAIATLVSLIIILLGKGPSNIQGYFGALSFGVPLSSILNLAALCCGIVYLLQGYSKRAANYYKAFFALMAAFNALTVYTTYATNGMGVSVVLLAVKVILLLILAFGKDLGKRNSWILFWAMLAVYVVFLILRNNFRGIAVYRLIVVLSKLVMDGTIGLAIKGKYDDKDARGTI